MRIDEIFDSTNATQQKLIRAKVSKRSTDEAPKRTHGNRHRRSAQFPGFPQFSNQQNAAGNALAQNQNPFFNQNAGANTHTDQLQNQFGNFFNTGGSSIGSNLANNGLSGQLSAANTDIQKYQTALGFGEKNNAQSQSANFNPFGLQTSNANTGKCDR